MLANVVMSIKVSLILWGAVTAFTRLVRPEEAIWVKGKPLGIMVSLYCIGMLCHYVWVLYAVLVAILPMTAKSRAEGAALFVVAIAAVPDLTTALFIGGAAILNINKWLCLTLGFLIVFLREPRAGLPYSRWFDLPFVILLALELVQARGMNFTSAMRSLLSTMLTIGMPYYILTRSIGRLEDLRRIILAVSFVGFVLSVVAVFESRTHFLVYEQMYGPLNVVNAGYHLYKLRGGLLRSMTSFGDSTAFSLFLTIAFMATVASRARFKTTSRLAVAMAVICLGIFVTSSRNAWLTLALGVLMFDLYRRRYVALAGKMAVLGMGYAFLLLLAQFSPYVNTMIGNGGDTGATSDYRSELLTRGIEEFKKHPYLGLDIKSVMNNMQDMRQGEGIIDFVNGYLFYGLTAGYAGVIGLFLGLLLPALAMLKSRRLLFRHGVLTQRYAAFVFSITIAAVVTSALTGFGGTGSTYLYLMIGVGGVLYAWRRLPAEMFVSIEPPPRARA